MAVDNESKRASVLNAGSFFPGRIPYKTEPDAGDLDSATQRGLVLWHYFGISASTVAVVTRLLKLLGHGL